MQTIKLQLTNNLIAQFTYAFSNVWSNLILYLNLFHKFHTWSFLCHCGLNCVSPDFACSWNISGKQNIGIHANVPWPHDFSKRSCVGKFCHNESSIHFHIRFYGSGSPFHGWNFFGSCHIAFLYPLTLCQYPLFFVGPHPSSPLRTSLV